MNKIKTLVASVALAAGIPAMAAYHSTPAPMVPCKQHQLLPKVDMNQNEFFAQCDWEKRIKVSGLVTTSYGYASKIMGASYTDVFHGLSFNDNVTGDNAGNDLKNVESGSDIWLQRAVVNVDAVLNDWAETHVGMLYWNDLNSLSNADAMLYNRYHGRFQANGNNLPVDEANLVLGNFAQSPVYFRLGRQYTDFGWYDKTNAIAPLTQLFSQGLHDAVTVGFMDISGFNGSIAAFRSVDRGSVNDNNGGVNPMAIDRPSDSVNNFVASLGYGMDNGNWGFDAKVDYMHDVFGVDFFDGYLGNGIIGGTTNGFRGMTVAKANNIRPNKRDSMWAFTLKGKWNDFDAMGQFVGVSGRLSEDLWTSGGTTTSAATDTNIHGAKPSSWMVELGYSFALMGRDSRLSVNYQKTHESYAGNENSNGTANSFMNYYIPEKRWQVSFNHNMMKNVDLMASYVHDKDYGTSHAQSMNNRTSNSAAGNHGDQFDNIAGTGHTNNIFLLSVTGRFN